MSEIVQIRPAGRHLFTIGSDLIKDEYTAIIELVKNAYDADAENVLISICGQDNTIKFSIYDDGHGMSYDTIINKWLVPSTDDKLKRKQSPKGRILQGRKGIGRFAAMVLGDELTLDTKICRGERSTVVIDWRAFEKAQYLNDVGIILNKSNENNDNHYTHIDVIGNQERLLSWLKTKELNDLPIKISQLSFELRKLISPLYRDEKKDEFNVVLKFKGLSNNLFEQEKTIKIEPLPILDLYDYRISGVVNCKKIDLRYENNKNDMRECVDIKEFSNFDNSISNIGNVKFDLKVYDRDTSDLADLLERGNKYYNLHYTGVNEIKNILNELAGVGVYRNGFRIRPLGDQGYDWLKLDQKRVQNPSMKIGLNQIVGLIEIESEEISHLEEKSARDGLKENWAYEYLLQLFDAVINELEQRRFKYRRQVDKKNKNKTSVLLDTIFDYSSVKENINTVLVNTDTSVKENVIKILEKDAENKNKAATELAKLIAIYQGQATLGKIVNVILHEGRRPLNYFANQIDNFDYFAKKLIKEFDRRIFDKLLNMLSSFKTQTENLVTLFKKIDPLAVGGRGHRKKENLATIINDVAKLFEHLCRSKNIQIEVICDKDIYLYCWKQDIYTVLVNLIDNSCFWLSDKKDDKIICISVSNENNELVIDVIDNGRGIKKEDIESEIIFEPGYSTKNEGTGLGLALAGEACSRNNLRLQAIYSATGAHFQILEGKSND